jgi:hypothetical protein
VRVGLLKHVQHLRRFYADTKAGRPLHRDGWNYNLVQEWARTLRLQPYENDYPVRPRPSSCGCSSPQTFTLGVFPGGSKHRCGRCGFTWLELDGGDAPRG